MEALRFRWLFFTLMIGSAPILLRVIISTSSPKEEIPMVLLSEIIFFGLLFNASAAANLVADKHKPGVFLLIMSFVAVLSLGLVTFFILDLAGMPLVNVAWWIVGSLLFLSAMLSFFTTSSQLLSDVQMGFDFNEKVKTLPPFSQKLINHLIAKASAAGDLSELRKIHKALELYEHVCFLHEIGLYSNENQ